ncbi:hypothetical protein HZH66_014937 [Vespula vulgaris]|uniref:Uncharacterized protein n=1 Tax=Vespula vulgaris TaxID=7454 RepID=A0A834IZD7_VESVU|nr:hypothetical protein HZH66_014937 [Vespula vulgaris]
MHVDRYSTKCMSSDTRQSACRVILDKMHVDRYSTKCMSSDTRQKKNAISRAYKALRSNAGRMDFLIVVGWLVGWIPWEKQCVLNAFE